MEVITMYKSWDGMTFNTQEQCEEYERKNPPLHTYLVTMELKGRVTARVKASSVEQAKEMAGEVFYPEDVDYTVTNFDVEEKD